MKEEMSRIIASLSSEVLAARKKESELTQSFREMESQLGDAAHSGLRLIQLKREADANRSIYETFLARYKQTMEQGNLSAPDARLISRAEPPGAPIYPNKLRFLLVGAFGGLAIGGALAFVRKGFDRRIRHTSEVETVTGVPVFGLLPKVSRWRGLQPQDYPVQDPHSQFCAALTRIPYRPSSARNVGPETGNTRHVGTAGRRQDFLLHRPRAVVGEAPSAGSGNRCRPVSITVASSFGASRFPIFRPISSTVEGSTTSCKPIRNLLRTSYRCRTRTIFSSSSIRELCCTALRNGSGRGMIREACCLALVTDAFGGHGGIAKYNRDFLGALANGGAVSSITVLPRHAPERIAAPAAIKQIPARPGRLAYAAIALLTAFRQRTDVVFCGHLYMAPLTWLIARLKGAKLIVQMHGIDAWPQPSRLQRAAAEAADLILCASRYTRAAVAGWAAIAPERILAVPNTVADEFAPGDGSALRAALGLKDERVLLTVGRMDSRERYKGHDRVIAAIPNLVAQGHDVIYIIIGEGVDRARLDDLARRAGVADRVHFLGAVSPQYLAEAYRMADLFVMPSTGEGFGIVFLEAMASGTPALGLDAPGASDALADGELGTVVSEDDLPVVIVRLLAMPKPDPDALSQAVRARFGGAVLRAQVGMAFDRLLQPA
jgi:phosphatidylinositol alpha-1,6-mannosyltransferase